MTSLQHEVWGRPPGKDEQVFFASFELSRWQWAEKLAAYLRDKGCLEVEIRLEEDDEDDTEVEEQGDE